MIVRVLAVALCLVLGGHLHCVAEQSGGPRTLDNLLNSEEAQETAAPEEVDGGQKRPAGTMSRPKDGVQHPELDKAWAYYEIVVGQVSEGIRAALAKSFDAAAAEGNLDAAEKWQKAIEAFEQCGELPAGGEAKAAVSRALADYKQARAELAKSYESVVKALTVEKKIAEAKAVRDEYLSIEAAARKVVASSPPVTSDKVNDTRGPGVTGTREATAKPVIDLQRALQGTVWKYDHGGDAFSFLEGGRVVRVGSNSVFASWRIQGAQVLVTSLEGEWVDKLTLSPSGTVLAGMNQRGVGVRATRVSVAD